jgi:predicted DsbA family dithiol-disulfide isomerase
MERTAAAEGLEYHLEGGVTGNTFDAHQLMQLARAHGLQDALAERFYRAHFTERRSIFDRDTLVSLAAEAGLDAGQARRALEDNAYADACKADLDEARALGAKGVPFFVIDRRYGVSGAQAPEVFLDALTRAWAPADPRSSSEQSGG